MNELNRLFVFTIMGQQYAVDLYSVERVIHAVEITRVPERSDLILGVINVHGKIISVINIRKMLGLPEREIDIDDFILLVNIPDGSTAFVIDSYAGVVDVTNEDITESGSIFPGLHSVEGIFKISGDVILIQNLEKLLAGGVMDEISTIAGGI